MTPRTFVTVVCSEGREFPIRYVRPNCSETIVIKVSGEGSALRRLPHSCRNARIGSTSPARRAGMNPATSETSDSSPTV